MCSEFRCFRVFFGCFLGTGILVFLGYFGVVFGVILGCFEVRLGFKLRNWVFGVILGLFWGFGF